MAIYQIFIKLLDGRTQCLQFPSSTISGETLKHHLSLITQIPLHLVRLITGTQEILNSTLIFAESDNLFPSLNLLLRLRGGKGGFGSLLRGAATKAGQKKTNNFDACRDMSGRRLRHVNAEKKLEEWRADAEERRLEKLAEEFLKKKAKEVKKKESGDVEKYLEKYREDSAKCMEAMEESVRESFGLYKGSKRKLLPTSGASSSKRLKIWLGKQKVDESDSDEDNDDDEDDVDGGDGGEEKSVVLDGGNCPSEKKEEEGSSAVALVSGANSDGDSSGEGSEQTQQSNLEEANGNSSGGESSGGGSENSNLGELNGNCDMESPAIVQGSGTGDSNSELNGSLDSEMGVPEEAAAENAVVSTLEEVPEVNEVKLATESSLGAENVDKEAISQTNDDSSLEEPLNFDKYNSAAELEVLGMERLKAELQARGLKCGGTVQERAVRLFLLKTIPLEKLPKKVLAAKPGAK